MKIVFDTNLYISAFLFKGGIISRLMEMAEDKRFKLYWSPEIRKELEDVLTEKFELDLHECQKILEYVAGFAEMTYPTQKIDLIKRCPADNQILECAVEAEVDFLVTGDQKDLVPLKHSYQFKILTPRAFYEIVIARP